MGHGEQFARTSLLRNADCGGNLPVLSILLSAEHLACACGCVAARGAGGRCDRRATLRPAPPSWAVCYSLTPRGAGALFALSLIY